MRGILQQAVVVERESIRRLLEVRGDRLALTCAEQVFGKPATEPEVPYFLRRGSVRRRVRMCFTAASQSPSFSASTPRTVCGIRSRHRHGCLVSLGARLVLVDLLLDLRIRPQRFCRDLLAARDREDEDRSAADGHGHALRP
jgi:hypothetical protein